MSQLASQIVSSQQTLADLQDVLCFFKTSLEDFLKTSSRYVYKKGLEDVFKTS